MTHQADKFVDDCAALATPAPRSHSGQVLADLRWPHAWVIMLSLAAVVSLLLTLARHPYHGFLPALGLVVCIAAAWSDSVTSRIPNALTYPAILLGLILSTAMLIPGNSPLAVVAQWIGAPEPLESLIGFGACAIGGVICVLLNGIGAGDLKLIAAMGAIFGLHLVGLMLLWALLVAIPLAVLNLLLDRKLIAFFHAAGLQLMTWFMLRKNHDFMVVSRRRMPIAVPLLVGAILGIAVPASVLPMWLSGVNG